MSDTLNQTSSVGMVGTLTAVITPQEVAEKVAETAAAVIPPAIASVGYSINAQGHLIRTRGEMSQDIGLVAGSKFWGSYANLSAFPNAGDGVKSTDFAFNQNNSSLYVWISGSWQNAGSLKGADGSPGIVNASAPLSYDSTTKTISLNTSGFVATNDARLTDARTPLAHTHLISQIIGLQAALDTKVDTSDARLTNARPPTAHTHAISDVTNLQTSLDSKAPVSHTHAQADITGLVAALAAKANSTHSHAIADVTGLQAAIDGKANLSHTHPGLFQSVYAGTISQTVALAISSGISRLNVTVAGVAVGDVLFPRLTGSPKVNGIAVGTIEVHNAFVTAANTVSLGISTPGLALAATYELPIALYRLSV